MTNSYSGALADKFGYEDVEKFRKEAYKYSLLNDGVLETYRAHGCV